MSNCNCRRITVSSLAGGQAPTPSDYFDRIHAYSGPGRDSAKRALAESTSVDPTQGSQAETGWHMVACTAAWMRPVCLVIVGLVLMIYREA